MWFRGRARGGSFPGGTLTPNPHHRMLFPDPPHRYRNSQTFHLPNTTGFTKAQAEYVIGKALLRGEGWAQETSVLFCVALGVCPLHPTLYILHPTPYTLHPTPYKLFTTPYTLHSTPQPQSPIPDTIHSKQAGWAREKNLERGFSWLDRAASQDHIDAMVRG